MSASILFEVVLKASAVLVLAWIVARVFGRTWSAAARHQVWAAALIVSLVMPGLVAFGPSWNITIGAGRWADRATILWGRSGGRLATADVWPRLVSPASHAPVSAAPVAGGAAGDVVTDRTPAAPIWSATTVIGLVVLVWAAGTMLGLVRLIVGMRSARAVVRSAGAVSEEWTALCEDAQRRLGRQRPTRVLMSSHTAVPVVCGVLRPAILLPLEAGAWDDSRRRAVLCHELAHVVRHDCLFRTIAQVARAVYWFHPLVIAAIGTLNAEQERACDDVVIDAGTPALEYVDHLYAIVRASQPAVAYGGATVAFAERSRLHHRIAAILDDTRDRRRPSRRFVTALWIANGVALALGAARPALVVNASTLLPSMAFDVVGRFAPAVATAPVPAWRGGGLDSATTGAAPIAQPSPARPGAEREFIAAYCLSCHNARSRIANVDLESFSIDRIAADPELGERIVRKVRSGLHPPVGVPRPERATADIVSRTLETVLDGADGGNWTPDRVEILHDRELAARVSRFLWSGEPDAPLLKLAAQGKLRDPRALHQQVARMLTDPRADAFVREFFDRWLSLKNLEALKPDPAAFPQFDDSLRLAMRKEMDLFLASQVRDDHHVAELLSANYTFVNDRLAQHYGLADRPGDQFRRVTLADQARFGLLGKGAVLAVTSYANRTSPVLRGKWVLETLVGVQPPPPPPNVPPLKNGSDLGSMRERMAAHAKNPVCAACHATLDAPGFALENFDAIGRWRNADGGSVIDANSQMADGAPVDGPAGLRDWLVERRELVVTTVTLKLLSYAIDRPAKLADMPAVRTIVRDAAATNYRWSSIIEGIVRSQPFRTRPLTRDTTR